MTINVTASKDDPKILKFPMLMESPDTGNIYLVTSQSGKGVCVLGQTTYSIGDRSDSLSINDFVPFTGKITLEND